MNLLPHHFSDSEAPLSLRHLPEFAPTQAAVHELQPMPAEACTELGADNKPVYRLGLFTLIRRAWLRWNLQCLRDERDHYSALGWIGPVYLRNSWAEELRLRRAIRSLKT